MLTHLSQAPPIEPPVISMSFGVNDSPLAGKEGNKLTSNFIRDRLVKETDHNPAVKFVVTGSDSFEVSGRGELQMSVLIENMRREVPYHLDLLDKGPKKWTYDFTLLGL